MSLCRIQTLIWLKLGLTITYLSILGSICDGLLDLVSFVQSKNLMWNNTPMVECTLSKFVGCNYTKSKTSVVVFTFLKLLIWYQIAQNVSFGSHAGIVNFLILCGCPLTVAENILYISYCYITGKCICVFSYLPNEQPVNIPLY